MGDDGKPPGAGDAPPLQAVVGQMLMGAWLSKTISDVTRLDIPDLLKQHGPLEGCA